MGKEYVQEFRTAKGSATINWEVKTPNTDGYHPDDRSKQELNKDPLVNLIYSFIKGHYKIKISGEEQPVTLSITLDKKSFNFNHDSCAFFSLEE